jgi:hypothetical protein
MLFDMFNTCDNVVLLICNSWKNFSNEGLMVEVAIILVCHDTVSSACQRIIRESIVYLSRSHWGTQIALLRNNNFDLGVNERGSHQSCLALFSREKSILEKSRLLTILVLVSWMHLLNPWLRHVALVRLHHWICLERWRCIRNLYMAVGFLT